MERLKRGRPQLDHLHVGSRWRGSWNMIIKCADEVRMCFRECSTNLFDLLGHHHRLTFSPVRTAPKSSCFVECAPTA